MTTGLGVLLAVGIVAAPAGPDAIEIREEGEGCPAMTMRSRVEAYLAEGPGASGAMQATSTLSREEDTWKLELRLGETVRVFRAPRCDTVIDAGAFVIAVAADPSVADRPAPPREEEEAPPDPAPGVVPDPSVPTEPEAADGLPEPEPEPAEDEDARPDDTTLRPPSGDREETPRDRPRDRRRIRARTLLGVELGVDGGALPGAGLLLRPYVGAAFRYARVEATGMFRTRADATADQDPDAGGSVGAWAAGVRGCGLPPLPRERLELPLCLGLEGGQILADGFGFAGAQSTTLTWLGINLSAGLAWAPVPSFALFGRAELGFAPLGGELSIDGLGAVHTVRAVYGRGLAGVEVRLGGRSRR